MADHAEFVANNMGWYDSEPGLKNTPVADMVAKIKGADAQGETIIDGIVEMKK